MRADPSEIRNVTLGEVTEFEQKWYVPNNAVLVLSGAFHASEVKSLVARAATDRRSFPRGCLGLLSFPRSLLV